MWVRNKGSQSVIWKVNRDVFVITVRLPDRYSLLRFGCRIVKGDIPTPQQRFRRLDLGAAAANALRNLERHGVCPQGRLLL
jgi:hypothetical protein